MSNNQSPIIESNGGLRIRKSITRLTDQELNNLRRAYEGLYAISADGGSNDERGYQWIAGLHGHPSPVYCIHGPVSFLPWHRAYIYEFEQRLQEIDPRVMLPYWDWTSQEAINNGLPPALTDETYIDLETGDTKPNPLRSASSQATGRFTSRSPRNAAQLQLLKEAMADAQEELTFGDYSPANEGPHGGIHVWVGGDMSSIATAAYDPIFWLHHCNVDRLWFEWQQEHGDSTVPSWVRNFICSPFSYTGEQTLDTAFFGYTYADDESFITPDEAEATPEDMLTPTMVFDVGNIAGKVNKAELVFYGLKKTKEAYEVRVFCDAGNMNYDQTSECLGNEFYGGSLFILGHGKCPGGRGHCAVKPRRPYDRRPEHHLTPYNAKINITKTIQSATAEDGGKIVLSFVVLDADEAQVDPSVIEFDGISLITKR